MPRNNQHKQLLQLLLLSSNRSNPILIHKIKIKFQLTTMSKLKPKFQRNPKKKLNKPIKMKKILNSKNSRNRNNNKRWAKIKPINKRTQTNNNIKITSKRKRIPNILHEILPSFNSNIVLHDLQRTNLPNFNKFSSKITNLLKCTALNILYLQSIPCYPSSSPWSNMEPSFSTFLETRYSAIYRSRTLPGTLKWETINGQFSLWPS